MKEIKIWQMILIWIGTIFLLMIGDIIYSIYTGVTEINDIMFGFILLLSLLSAMLICARVKLKSVKERWKNFKEIANIKEMLIVVINQIVLSIGISNLSLALLASHNMKKALESINDTFGSPTNNNELVLSLITIVILAPLLEEIIYRRVIFRRLNIRFSFIFSSVISSLVFGIGHELLAILSAIIFGITCCILYRKYKNLLVPIAVHFGNNLIAGIFMTVQYFDGTLNEQINVITEYDIKLSLILGIVLTTITMIIFIKFIMKNRKYLKKESMVLKVSHTKA